MKPRKAKTTFLDRLATSGLSLNALTLAVGVNAMLEFYAAERAEDCPLDEDGDMLLFQWGTYDWGAGLSFEVSVTRQFCVANEDEPRQLNLKFRFEPSLGASAGEENRWCPSPDGLSEFRRFVTSSAAFQAVGQRSPLSVELRYERT